MGFLRILGLVLFIWFTLHRGIPICLPFVIVTRVGSCKLGLFVPFPRSGVVSIVISYFLIVSSYTALVYANKQNKAFKFTNLIYVVVRS